MWKIKLKVDGGLIRFYKVSLYDIVYTGKLLIYNELMYYYKSIHYVTVGQVGKTSSEQEYD
jgi:hypothetical protein